MNAGSSISRLGLKRKAGIIVDTNDIFSAFIKNYLSVPLSETEIVG